MSSSINVCRIESARKPERMPEGAADLRKWQREVDYELERDYEGVWQWMQELHWHWEFARAIE